MSVKGMGTRREGRQMPWLALVSGGLLLAALVLLAVELSRYTSSAVLLQADVTVGGIPVGGKSLTEAVRTWETVYAQPVQLDYGDSPILLYPNQIGFNIKSDQMQGQVQARSAGSSNYWVDFWNYLWRRPSKPVDIALAAEYQKPRLQAFLTDVAARYEQRAGNAFFDLNTLTFGSGSTGRRIDIDAAIPLIDSALRRATNRRVTLPLKIEAAGDRSMSTLKTALAEFLSNFSYLESKGLPFDGPGTIGSIVVVDLATGNELSINPSVAFSAASTIKIPIMINRFRAAQYDIGTDIRWLMAASALCSSNSASNLLIKTASNYTELYPAVVDGLTQINTTMKTLGAKNTYLSAPLFVKDDQWKISIAPPAISPDKTLGTKPDPFSQTTTEDMAILLQEMYECAEYNTGLRTFYPDAFTQTECRQMIELFGGNQIGRLIELGVPPGTRVVHKNGWAGTQARGANVEDAAIVYSPGGTYIVVIYIWESRANQDGIGSLDAWRAVEGLSRVVYNYFNPETPLLVARKPENPNGAIDCVMPNPNHPERVDLNNIKNGRFDENGGLVPDACVNYPGCLSNPAEATKKPQ